jgi:hypothetical protein
MMIMQAWRSDAGIVVDLGPTHEPVLETLINELPRGIWRELRDYLLLDSDGHLLEKFTITTWSIEEELGISAFALIDEDPGIKAFAVAKAALCNLRVRTFHSSNFRVEREQETILDGLQEVLPRELAAIAVLVEQALASAKPKD